MARSTARGEPLPRLHSDEDFNEPTRVGPISPRVVDLLMREADLQEAERNEADRPSSIPAPSASGCRLIEIPRAQIPREWESGEIVRDTQVDPFELDPPAEHEVHEVEEEEEEAPASAQIERAIHEELERALSQREFDIRPPETRASASVLMASPLEPEPAAVPRSSEITMPPEIVPSKRRPVVALVTMFVVLGFTSMAFVEGWIDLALRHLH
jgi:hypothetical protein